MIVVCEGCERRFQLDDSRIPAKGARVRCKYCQHRFRVPPPGDASTEAADPSAAAPDEATNAETAGASPSDSIGGMSAGAPGQISAEDTLFGTPEGEGVGAPIDGDRTLFGSLVEDEPAAPPGPAEPAGEQSSGGLTQDLQFVVEPPMERTDGDHAEAPAAEADAAPDEPAPAAAQPAEPDAEPAMQAEAEEPEAASDEAEPENLARSAEPEDLAQSAEPEDLAQSAEPEDLAQSAEPEDLAASAADAADDEVEEPGGNTGNDDSWEFVDSSLSFDEELHEDAAEDGQEAGEPPPSDEAEGGAAPMHLDPGASHPDASAAVVDDTPSMRPIAPGAGGDSAIFEMVENEDYDAPLQLEGEEASKPAEAEESEAPAASAAPDEPEPPAEAPEIGTAADWDRLAADGEPASGTTESEDDLEDAPASVDAAEPEAEPDADWSRPPEDLPEPAVVAAAQGSNAWLEHAGWALSLVLLLAVAQGTVRIEPVLHESPPGHVEIAGLMAENVRGRFVENARSGTLFVVSGELRNRGGAAHAGGELRIVVLDEHGFTFEGRNAPVGLALSESMVRETPIGALQQQQALLARTLGARALSPGEGVSFQAILGELPEGAVRFRLESLPGEPARGPGHPGGGFAEPTPEAG